MGQAIINHDRHNAAVLTRAIQRRGGKCRVDCIPVMCSDDETLISSLRRMENIDKKPWLPQNVVALK